DDHRVTRQGDVVQREWRGASRRTYEQGNRQRGESRVGHFLSAHTPHSSWADDLRRADRRGFSHPKGWLDPRDANNLSAARYRVNEIGALCRCQTRNFQAEPPIDPKIIRTSSRLRESS